MLWCIYHVKKVKISSKYSDTFMRFLKIFEYIGEKEIQYSYLNIKYSANNIIIYLNICNALLYLSCSNTL